MKKEDLKEFRDSMNMSQQEIAKLLGVTQPSWNYYETGKRDIPEYIQRSIEFFQALSKRSQQQFINKTRPDGEQTLEPDLKRAGDVL